ncbi:MAG: MotA/TolQ/ExbB proton channel family protein [Alphaproteobacteria bacterium]|nr:MotA/TolQ/ExbB proton channel family protein [Alphaproteobacteria bacterium]
MDKDAAGSDLPGVQAPVAELAEGAGAAPDSAFERILEIIQAGGPVVLLLIAVSIVATAVILLKIWQFSRTNVGKSRNGPIAVRLYKEGHVKEALAAARRARSPVGEVLARAIRGRQRNLPEAKIREEVLRYGGDVLESLRGGFRILEVIASLSPLLGLFGTVLGMIEAFRALEAAGNQINPAILSGGIWQALLTTAVGLAIAIPVVAILNWLERRVDGLAHEMDNLVTQLFTEDLSEEASLEGAGHRDRTDFAAAVA